MVDPATAQRRIMLPFERRDCAACVATVERSMREINHDMARERNISGLLQDALLPTMPDHMHDLNLAVCYKAALDESGVGGDFYDVFPLEENTVALVVGDVCGKGLAAASQIGIVRYMLRYALYTRVTLAGAINELNIQISDHRLLGPFATLFVGIYNKDLRSLTYVSCGQEPALLLRNSACREIEILEPTGPVLGISTAGDYEERDIQLFPGDALAIYTDGLTESGPSHTELLAVSGLINLLRKGIKRQSASQLAEYLCDSAKTHSETEFQDDICLMVAMVDDGVKRRK